MNYTKNDKKLQIILFAGIIGMMILPFGTTSDTFAQSEPGEDSTGKTGPVGTVNESADIKLQELEKKQQDLKNKHHAINEEFNSTNSTKKIIELKSDYIQTIKELNVISYVEPERDYLAEWTALDSTIMDLEDKQIEEYSEQRQQIIDALYQQMHQLDQNSIDSMKLDLHVKEELESLESELIAMYFDHTADIYVGKSSVIYPYIDHEQQNVVLLIDETKTLDVKDISSISIAQNVLENYNVTVAFTTFTEISCSNVTSDCDPLIGGISLARDDSRNSLAGSVGFRAKDSSNNVGFVTAGHVVQYRDSTNTQMHQPVGGSAVGTIPDNGDMVCYTAGGVDIGEQTSNNKNCDFAFVKMNSGVSINDDIYKSSRSTYDINSMATESNHREGKLLKWIGAVSGVQQGRINACHNLTQVCSIEVNSHPSTGGDSGGPVFEGRTASRNTFTANIFGINTHIATINGENLFIYEPSYKIMDELNLRPYH